MIFYTVLPVEDVFEDEEERQFVSASIGGCPVLVESLGEGRGRVERVLSTDPSHYMTPGVQPGSIVDLL